MMMTPSVYFDKANQACASAKLLLDAGDLCGACNRTYYAMFNAARAALLASGVAVSDEIAKTHSGLLSAFSLRLVKTGELPIELGRHLKHAGQMRILSDYRGGPLDDDEVRLQIERADAFVQAIRKKYAL
jgi:uncharacterized protein (UPF0332 family)